MIEYASSVSGTPLEMSYSDILVHHNTEPLHRQGCSRFYVFVAALHEGPTLARVSLRGIRDAPDVMFSSLAVMQICIDHQSGLSHLTALYPDISPLVRQMQ